MIGYRMYGVVRDRCDAADCCSAAVGILLVALAVAHAWTDLTYDESVYLRLARTISETGLPLRRSYGNFNSFDLFRNSPPLVLYTAATTQLIAPGSEVPARGLHLAVFALPTYALVWFLARRNFGSWAGFAALCVLLTSGDYLRASSHVLLDIPLGLFACVGLACFVEAAGSGRRARLWTLIAAAAVVLALWTKYQAVCLVTAIVVYGAYILFLSRRRDSLSVVVPLAAVVAAGVGALAALVTFFFVFGGQDSLAQTLRLNLQRSGLQVISLADFTQGVATTARECEARLGGTVLLLAATAFCLERRQRDLLFVAGCYVATTIAFNLLLFRLPGSGTFYLDSVVPAVAIMSGAGAVALARVIGDSRRVAVFAVAVAAIQFAGTPPGAYRWPAPNASRMANDYIVANSVQTNGVLAETVAIEFYSGRPVRALPWTFPTELLLRSLDGTSGDDITFVVVRDGVLPRNLEPVRADWDRLLRTHFKPVWAGAGLHVFQRARSQR